jgi:hypothetical protein
MISYIQGKFIEERSEKKTMMILMITYTSKDILMKLLPF